MLPDLGHLALILALQLALLQGILPLFVTTPGKTHWWVAGRRAAYAQCLLVSLALAVLAWSFYVNDFSVRNVAEHSSLRLPVIYRLTATWGSHEGSILLWAWMLTAWSALFCLLGQRLPMALGTRATAILGWVAVGFLAYILLTSSPFLRLEPPPPDGRDLNPLLQDPGMIIHPPLLYMGYVGFAIVFALALAGLLTGQLDRDWAARARPWANAAWFFLTLGIAIGSWWAYRQLGWGGWWFWDPTENASLMPWLVGTALLHALAMGERQGLFGLWSAFLAIVAFSLSLVGTFLVRSGVLSSVHAFAFDPTRGLFILIFLGLIIGGSLLLFALRAQRIRPGGRFALCSLASLVLAGNTLLLIATATVLLGTLYPLALDALGLAKVSVGPPYFNTVFIPLAVPALFLAGLAARLPGNNAAWAALFMRLRAPLPAALIAGLLFSLIGGFDLRAWIALSLAAWLLIATLPLLRRSAPLAIVAMALAHGGLAIAVAGMGLVSAYESETSLVLRPGEHAKLGGYQFTLESVKNAPGANFSAMRAQIAVSRDGQAVATLHPEKRVFTSSRMPMSESDLHSTWRGDLYAALGDSIEGGAWSLRLFIKPFVSLIWAGSLLMALGALLAVAGRLRRNPA